MPAFSGATGRWKAILILAGALLVAFRGTAFGQSQAPPDAAQARLAEARRHFELGVSHFDRGEWQAALVEFLSSRELAPTRSNTKNLAICLRKVGRFDEALDTFEALLRDFPDLPAGDRELALREISELGASVGTLEIRDVPAGARVSIDGLDRGTAPFAAPLRLPAGTHAVRVVKEGSLPFEARIDLAGRQAAVLPVKLLALTHAGRVRVSEKNGRNVEVIVDGSRVGTAPWDGALAPGAHSVSLRGEGELGTPPERFAIELGKELALELTAIQLNAELAIGAEPATAEIFVDGASAGRGAWNGRLRSGPHRITVTLEGYAAFARELTLAEGEKQTISATLEPSVSKARILLEVDAGLTLGLRWGGDLEDGCTSPCSSSFPTGIYALAHATYRFAIGLGVGIQAGYFRMSTTLENRSETLSVTGVPGAESTVDDELRMGGLLAGAEADYRIGVAWPLTLRVAAGALIGTVTDTRTGTFVDSMGGSYDVSPTQYPRASYFYIGPEVRLGYRAGEHFQASVGAKLMVLAALVRPAWDSAEPVYAGADKGGVFPAAHLTDGIMVAVLPGLALEYAF